MAEFTSRSQRRADPFSEARKRRIVAEFGPDEREAVRGEYSLENNKERSRGWGERAKENPGFLPRPSSPLQWFRHKYDPHFFAFIIVPSS